MTVDTASPRSRRAILTAALGAGVATIASALGRPMAAQAADGDIVQVGHAYAATHTTQIDAGTSGEIALRGISASGDGLKGESSSHRGVFGYSYSGTGVLGASFDGFAIDATTGSAVSPAIRGTSQGDNTGVQGYSGAFGTEPATPVKTGVYGSAAQDASAVGVKGESTVGVGVAGTSTSNIGVVGKSSSFEGVWGESSTGGGLGSGAALVGYATSKTGPTKGAYGVSESTLGAGVVGESRANSTGVIGLSLSAAGPYPTRPAKTGVYGYAIQDAAARGVTGQTTLGYGVNGVATTGRALNGAATTGYGAYSSATSGIGSRGYAATGTGGYFSTSGPKVGVALRALGRVKLDNCAGIATIASGTNSVTVTPGSDLLTTCAVVATLMGSAGGLTTVHRVVLNATTDTFTIYLTANATAAVKVAWHVFG